MTSLRRAATACLVAIVALTTASRPAVAQGEDVSIEMTDGVTIVKTQAYEYRLSAEGIVDSLKVGGVDFTRGSQAAYFYQGGVLKLPDITREGQTVTASSDLASLKTGFAEDALTWTFTNKSEKDMVFVIVMNPQIGAVQDAAGDFWKAPLETGWETSTWYLQGVKLRFEGSTRLWGPFGGNHQIWEVKVTPGETRSATIIPGQATDQEIAQAEEAAKPVPPPEDPDGPMWDLQRLSTPPQVYPAEGFEAEGMEAVFFQGEPFRGRETRVFAWIGMPEHEPGEKVPGMVLVHGGGGTAFDTWVRLWNERGYAAISMDTCGAVPRGKYGAWERHEHSGPPGWGGFGQMDWAREDQWTYHAVADALLAHSLLRSMPDVDPDRIGLTGISWGGYLTSIIAGVDPRYKFAAPVYGCGYYLDTTFGSSVRGIGGEKTDRWMRWWDPSNYLRFAAMPMVWVTGTNDFAYWFPGLQQSYRATQGPRSLCVTLRMPHGHGPAGEAPEVIRAAADHYLKGGPGLTRFTAQGRKGSSVWATYEAPVPVTKAELLYTTATGNWPDREWLVQDAELVGGNMVRAELPEGTTVYFLNVIDERGLACSTEHKELTQ